MKESERWAQTLPQIPRLVHQALTHAGQEKQQLVQQQIAALERQQREIRQMLWFVIGLMLAMLVVLGIALL